MSYSVHNPDSTSSEANNSYLTNSRVTKIFLAGSIEQGKAIDWQQYVIDSLKGQFDVSILNPRRSTWNADLEQSMLCEEFRYQVTWEQKWILTSDIVLMNLLPETYSPISLLELGQLTTRQKRIEKDKDQETVVVCPKSFWRRGNVEMVCSLFKIPIYETLDEGIAHVKTLLQLR